MSRKNPKVKVIVVGIGLRKDSIAEIKESLNELEDIVWASHRDIVGSVVQQLAQYIPSTLLGKGKISEIKDYIHQTQAEQIIVDRELSGTQKRNLEKSLKIAVIDRTEIILEIFAKRAKTYEGQLQVQMAQLLNELPKVVGGWHSSLSRQGGGGYSRGPGEKALEKDRRQIENRIKVIRKKLKEMKKNRWQQRAQRKRNKIPHFGLIGYTNSGKSTLLRTLSGSHVFVKDQVFATLDPTTRKVSFKDGQEVLVTDTVGFIRKLPQALLEAFEATLEEASEVDVLLVIIDLSKRDLNNQVDVVESIIEKMKWSDKPILWVYNKMDLVSLEKKFQAQKHPRVFINSLAKEGFDPLYKKMKEMISQFNKEVTLFFPKEQEHKIFELIRMTGQQGDLKKESHAEGTVCKVKMPTHQLSDWKSYLVKKIKF